MVRKKHETKTHDKDKNDFVKPLVAIPDRVIIDNMLRNQKRHWEISDGTKVLPDAWYKSKRGHLVLLKKLLEDGSVTAMSHTTGNIMTIPPSQIINFTTASDPGSPCGTIIIESNKTNGGVDTSDKINTDIYVKYPHVIQGSIYKVQNISSNNNNKTPTWEKKRKNNSKKVSIKGQVRCKIACQEPGCTNERDIKVQDAFQVKKCDECRTKKRKKNLKKFLDKKVQK